jgi:hypothetical protein
MAHRIRRWFTTATGTETQQMGVYVGLKDRPHRAPHKCSSNAVNFGVLQRGMSDTDYTGSESLPGSRMFTPWHQSGANWHSDFLVGWSS